MRNSKQRFLDVELLDCGGWTGRTGPRPPPPPRRRHWRPSAGPWHDGPPPPASHPASSCPCHSSCHTSLACCWAAACLWGWWCCPPPTALLYFDKTTLIVWLNILLYALPYKTQSSLSLQILPDFPFHICPSPKLSVSKHLILLGDVHLAVKSKVFKWENILVLEDFSLPQLTFLKLVRPWIMTKDHSIGFLISLKLLINHQEARSNHSTPNLSHLDITEVSVDSE